MWNSGQSAPFAKTGLHSSPTGELFFNYRVEQLARDAKSLMIYAGSNEIQVTHIAKGLLAR